MVLARLIGVVLSTTRGETEPGRAGFTSKDSNPSERPWFEQTRRRDRRELASAPASTVSARPLNAPPTVRPPGDASGLQATPRGRAQPSWSRR